LEEVQNRWHALWQIDRLIKNKKTDKEKKMRNDYNIRPRAKMKKGGKADMITKKMPMKKKGKMMKGKR
jgi:hypothetical protein